jgi:hypothetical protein
MNFFQDNPARVAEKFSPWEKFGPFCWMAFFDTILQKWYQITKNISQNQYIFSAAWLLRQTGQKVLLNW